MTRDQGFIDRWTKEKSTHFAWGAYLISNISRELCPRIMPLSVDYFLKTKVSPRLKEDQKLVEKAFYRGKPYTDPYTEITDKVGIRFVVLLGSQLKLVIDSLLALPDIDHSKDRDYEEEQKRNPVTFDYAAVHFVVRPTKDVTHDGVCIPANTPCEVQIKTLLQHAYSELTHDTIYKPQIQATPAMRRNAAKSMALLEATNDYFEKVSTQVSQALESVREITKQLSEIYKGSTHLEPSPSLLEGILLEAYEPIAGADYAERVRSMLSDRPFLIDRIKERVAQRSPLFAQPSIFLPYLDIVDRGRRALSRWPLTEREMEPMLNDLGESMH